MWEFCEVTLGTSFPDGERTMLTMKNQTKIPPTLFIVYVEMGVRAMVYIWGSEGNL